MNMGSSTNAQIQQGIVAKIWIFGGLLYVAGNILLIEVAPSKDNKKPQRFPCGFDCSQNRDFWYSNAL
jgi:hypothetical protein